MARIGATSSGGCNRQALTDEDRAGRDLFCRWAKEAGASIRVDTMGNIFASRSGRRDLAPVLMGSHLDTQPTGGKFDGVYGVLAGLEVLRTLNDGRLETDGPLEVVVWTNEEGARFSPAMVGSGVWAGALVEEDAYTATDSAGASFRGELERIGYRGSVPAKPFPIHGAFEVHIEQGPVLEHRGDRIGVVVGVQGMRWYDLTIDGVSCHAGTTPMAARNDPAKTLFVALSRFFEALNGFGEEARATVGVLRSEPASRNTVPHRVATSVDLRHPEPAHLDRLEDTLRGELAAVCEADGTHFSLSKNWDSPPVVFDAGCVDAVRRAVTHLGYAHHAMVSGAGHDSVYVSRVAPTAMIFVPCLGGLSHNEAESADPEDLEAGANVLLHAVLARDEARD